MSIVSLVRHGQAQTGAVDEESYDNLSKLGRDQALWLGQYLAASSHGVDHIIAGPLNRQRQTAEILGEQLGIRISQDDRLREMDYFGLATSVERTHALPFATDREGFITHIPQIMQAWQAGDIDSRIESFDTFANRVSGALHQAEEMGGRVMLVTSGGVIGMALKHILTLDMPAFSHMLIQICNSSLHRYVRESGNRMLDTFNATPHLDRPDRAEARTYT